MARLDRVWARGAVALLLLAGADGVHAGTAALDSASINGVVVDAVTGRPLPGTIVRVVGLGRQDVTHDGGEFHLINLPAGRYTVLFERLGYGRVVRELQLAAGQSVDLRIEMRPSAIELPGIVVTGTPRASLGEQTVRPARVVSGQDLARKLDITLAGTLRTEPGMATTSIGPATARPVIRGLGGDRVLVLEDGARVGDLSSSSSDHALSVDPLNAQRIEVVRGPSALLYGSNAIGGVINLIRDEVPSARPERPTGVVSVQAQSVNAGAGAGASGQAAAGRLVLRGEGSFRQSGDLRTPHGALENTDLRTYSLSAGASRVARAGHAGAAYRYYDNSYGIPGGFVGSHPEGVTIEMRRHSVHAQALTRRAGPLNSAELDLKYTNYYHRELESDGSLGTEFGLLAAAAELIGRHEQLGRLSSGAVGARLDWEDFVAGGSSRTPPSQSVTAALFVLEELDFGRMRLQGGGRLDWHRVEPGETTTATAVRTRTFGSYAASLGALYDLDGGVGIGVSLARAYRTPASGELFSQGPHLAAYSFEIGNPDLEAEVGVGIDVFVRAARDRFNAEAAAFRNVLDNYIYYRDTGTLSPTGLPVYQATGTDARLEGFELSGALEVVRRFVLSGVASYVRGTVTETGEPLPMMPPLHAQLTARYELPRLFVGVTWRGTAEQDRAAEFETATPGSTVIEADAGVRWVALGRVHSITLRGDNLTNAVVYDHLSRIRERGTDQRAAGAGAGVSMIYRVVF
jgi:iron complex outermembrane recepter protein